MKRIKFGCLILLVFLLCNKLFSASDTTKFAQKDTLIAKTELISLNISSDIFNFKFPNSILLLLGYKPLRVDTIILSVPIDSISTAVEPIGYKLELKDSTRLCCILENDNIQGIRSEKGRGIIVNFFKKNTLEKKTIYLQATTYGNWIFWLLIPIVVIIALAIIFRKVILSNLKISSNFIYQTLSSLFKIKEKQKSLSVVENDVYTGDKKLKISINKLIGGIQKDSSKILNAISDSNKEIMSKLEELKSSKAKETDFERRIIEKEKEIERKNIELKNANQLKENLENEIKRLKAFQVDELRELNKKINEINKEKAENLERYQNLQNDYNLLKSYQNELSETSIKITSIDKKKMERYKEVFRVILKLSHDVPQYILNLSFSNANLISELNKIIMNNFIGNYEDVFRFRDDNENILAYQRTESDKVRDKFPSILTIEFEEFDHKYRELIFDNCISGKVDKIFIGLQLIYGLKYAIQVSPDDLNKYDKMCDQMKSLEHELVLNLKLGGFEPFSISLFEELNIQKSSYIENIGGLSLKEKFPFYEKRPEQRNLILDIVQWAYKKDSGLWKNRKALVKISI